MKKTLILIFFCVLIRYSYGGEFEQPTTYYYTTVYELVGYSKGNLSESEIIEAQKLFDFAFEKDKDLFDSCVETIFHNPYYKSQMALVYGKKTSHQYIAENMFFSTTMALIINQIVLSEIQKEILKSIQTCVVVLRNYQKDKQIFNLPLFNGKPMLYYVAEYNLY